MARKKKRTSLYIGGIMVFFAVLSGGYFYSHSYGFYRASEETLRHTEAEQRYVADQLENLQINLLRKKYDTESIGLTREENLNRIDLRGVNPSPEEDRVFSENDVLFTVIDD